MLNLKAHYGSLAHAPVHVTDFPVVNVHVDELSSFRIWQHKLCTTLSASVITNYRLPIKAYKKDVMLECLLHSTRDIILLCNNIHERNMKIYPLQRIIFPEGNARREYDTRE
jgi:hypothetical protein